jgi:serine/threonine-protein kinase
MAAPVPPDLDETLDHIPQLTDLGQTQMMVPDEAPIPLADEPPKPSPGSRPVVKLTALGDFRLIGKLGQGGMGTVYKAEQITKKRFVALKVINRDLTSKPGYIQRFQREARAMGKLSHPNLIRCYSAGESHGFLYLAMEFMDGGSLASRISERKKLKVPEAVAITMAIAEGVQHAHDQGLVHRDIKPDNILFTATGVPKLSDLGLAKSADDLEQGLTQTGTGIGTPIYAPLEQILNAKTADARSDLFALGGVLYACLTGRPPFHAETLLAMIRMKEKGVYLPAGQLVKDVPAELDRILAKMLAKLPDHRYHTCADLLRDLTVLSLAAT